MKPTGAPDSRRPLLCRATLGLLCLWLLALATASFWRGLTLWRTRALLAELGSKLSPGMLTLFVVLTALCGTGLTIAGVGLWRRREWGRQIARASIVAYYVINQAYVWFFVQSGLLWERRWVNLALALGAGGVSFGVLSWHRCRQWLGLRGHSYGTRNAT